MGFFSNAQGQLTPQYVVKSGNEEDSIKSQSTRELLNKLIVRFFRSSRAANSEVGSGIPPKFKLVQAFMIVLITCKNKKNPIKNEGSRVLTRFSPL